MTSLADACTSQAYALHVLHALPHDVTGRYMQLLHGLCYFDFILDIPLSPATLPFMTCCNYNAAIKTRCLRLFVGAISI